MNDTLSPEVIDPSIDNDHTIWVHASKWHLLEEKVTKANRRLARNGIAQGFEVVETGRKESVRKNGVVDRWTSIEVVTPEVTGIEGWDFIATVKFEEGGTLIQAVPGQSLEGYVRPEDHTCDHCNTRRNRTRSYLVREEATGAIKQIGANCLNLFFGLEIKNLWALEWAADLDDFSDADDELTSSGRSREPYLYNVRFVLALAHVLTNGGRGFVSRGAARDDDEKVATADLLGYHVHYVPRPSRDWRDAAEAARIAENMEAARTLLAEKPEVIDSILAAADTIRPGDYKDNMMVAVRSENISGAALGVLVSLVMVWHRNNEDAIKATREAKEDNRLNEHVGAVKERLRDLTLTVTTVREIEGDYGVSTLIIMEDAEGRTFKWFASGCHEVETGNTVTLTGTVKGHDDYQGRKQTSLSRCKYEVVG